VDSARRLRVTAARRGVPSGQVLDELIQARLEPDIPSSERPHRETGPGQPPRPWTTKLLVRMLADLDLTQSAFARELGLTQKAVNNWIHNGRIPIGRQADIDQAVNKLRGKKSR
jgi:hypothetical protein